MEAIQDHALIGDCRAAALVSRRGSISWLCWPRFDSPSIFGALLDDRGGNWTVRPRGSFRSTQRYLEGTNVLETRFTARRIGLELATLCSRLAVDGRGRISLRPRLGNALVSPASVLAATVAFLLSRSVAREWIAARLAADSRLNAVDRALEQGAFNARSGRSSRTTSMSWLSEAAPRV